MNSVSEVLINTVFNEFRACAKNVGLALELIYQWSEDFSVDFAELTKALYAKLKEEC